MSDFTPQGATVRDAYARFFSLPLGHDYHAKLKEFDRWLANHDRQTIRVELEKAERDLRDKAHAAWAHDMPQWAAAFDDAAHAITNLKNGTA